MSSFEGESDGDGNCASDGENGGEEAVDDGSNTDDGKTDMTTDEAMGSFGEQVAENGSNTNDVRIDVSADDSMVDDDWEPGEEESGEEEDPETDDPVSAEDDKDSEPPHQPLKDS